MKIAILSLNPGHNYGGILQSYALKTVLERMGHEVSVICRKRELQPSVSLQDVPRYMVRLYRKLFEGSDVRVFHEAYEKKRKRKVFKETWRFCDEHLNLRQISSFTDTKSDEFDAMIVGSDQVWRPLYFSEQYNTGIDDAFLAFAEGWTIKRIAYAPSFGVDKWEYTSEQTLRCTKLLSRFDAVSVREEAGVELCSHYLNRHDVVCLCDPTILLSAEDYEAIVPHALKTISKQTLFVYCLDHNNELDALVSIVSNEKGLTPTYMSCSSSDQPLASVESWIASFINAEFIITDSFHACVFSLIFHKPFLVIGNQNRGMSRFESLLSAFHQSERLLYKCSDYEQNHSYPSLECVDVVLDSLRVKSNQFLLNSLL